MAANRLRDGVRLGSVAAGLILENNPSSVFRKLPVAETAGSAMPAAWSFLRNSTPVGLGLLWPVTSRSSGRADRVPRGNRPVLGRVDPETAPRHHLGIELTHVPVIIPNEDARQRAAW